MTEKTKPIVKLFTDGSCLSNPGPGGWAALLRYNNTEKMLSGSQAESTNNQMELMAVIKGLQALSKDCEVAIYTDSKYVLDGFTKWLDGWKARGWKKSDKKPVLNKELWVDLDKAALNHELSWTWVKGHSGHDENERVDDQARLEAENMKESLR
jgi:ribonuclease HI